MKTKIISLLFLLSISAGQLFAHNIWIETSNTGKAGKEHIAKVYLGGYGENERDSTQNWFSNTKGFVLYLIAPNGEKKQIQTKPGPNYFEAAFTPDKEGVYTLAIFHEVAEVYGTTKYQYHAAARIQVGAATTGANNIATANELTIQTSSKLKTVTVKTEYKGKSPGKITILVASPSGWSKTFETDANGVLTFDTIWPGLYVIEAFYKQDLSGILNGKDFKKVSNTATYSVEAGK